MRLRELIVHARELRPHAATLAVAAPPPVLAVPVMSRAIALPLNPGQAPRHAARAPKCHRALRRWPKAALLDAPAAAATKTHGMGNPSPPYTSLFDSV